MQHNLPVQVTVLLLAAGSGRRLGAAIPKQYLRVAGRTLMEHCLLSLSREPRIRAVQPVIAADDGFFDELIRGRVYSFELLPPVTGGSERAISMARGLAALSPECAWVAVHDAARPVPPVGMLSRLFDAAKQHGAAVPGLMVADTVKEVDAAGMVVGTLDRGRLRAVQTPQVARRAWFAEAVATGQVLHAHTDDASLLEAAGFPVFVCEGDAANRKITTQADLEWLQQYLGRGST